MDNSKKPEPNPDSAGLESWNAGKIQIGAVDEVNGPGAELCASFQPTREELMVLARHWAKEKLGVDFFIFDTGQSGSSEYRIAAFSRRRLNRIADVIGDEEVNP